MPNIFQILHSLTLWRLLNYVLVQVGYLLSVIGRRPVVLGLPFSMSVEVSAVCNLHCPECATGSGQLQRSAKYMQPQVFEAIIRQSAAHLLHLFLYFQGEPLLHPQLPLLVAIASRHRLYISLSTNGMLLTENMAKALIEARLSKIIVSIDGASEATYQRYRKGGQLAVVVENVRRLIALRRLQQSDYPIVELQFLVFAHNEHEMEQMKRLRREVGADRLRFKSARIDKPATDWYRVPQNHRYARYKRNKAGQYVIKSKYPNRCRRLWEAAVVTANGEVLPCCFDTECRFSLGEVPQSALRALWWGEKWQAFRQQILRQRSGVVMCTNCTEGLQ